MVRCEKLVLGLLVNLCAVSPMLAGNTIIGSFTADAPPTATNGTANKPDLGANKVTGSKGTSSEISNGTLDTSQASDSTTIGGKLDGTATSATKLEGTPTSATKPEQTSGGTTDSQFDKKVAESLARNPEAIVGALTEFNKRQQLAQQKNLEAKLMEFQSEISKDSGAVLLGNKDAEVKLVVFLDPNCPHCRPFSQALHKVREDFPNVAVLVRHWAILGKDSEDVVRGLWAIKLQGQEKYNAAIKSIATSEERFTFPKLLAWVQDHKLDVAKFKQDADSEATKKVINETKKLATDIGLEGTPTSLLVSKKDGVRIVVPTDEKSLESILKGAATAKA